MKSFVVIVSVFIFLGITSCGIEVTEAQLLGKWKVIGAEASNEKFKRFVNSFEGETYLFKPEGKLTYNDNLVSTVKKNGFLILGH